MSDEARFWSVVVPLPDLSPTNRDGAAVRELLLAAFQDALRAVSPDDCVARHLHRDGRAIAIGGRPFDVEGRVRIAAIGKAAPSMARGAVAILGDLVLDGVVVTDHFEAVPDPLRLVIGELGFPSNRGGLLIADCSF